MLHRLDMLVKRVRMVVAWAVFALTIGASLAVPVATAETLTNADVIKLVQAGLGSETIRLSIRSAADTKFDITSTGLTQLAKAGVPDAVIQSMQRRSEGNGAVAATPAVTVRPIKTVRRNVQPAAIGAQVGQSYYTRFNLWYERRKHSTTNYSRGTLLPVNSKVTLESIEGKKMRLQLASGESITVVLAEKFSLRPLTDIASELLSSQLIPLARLGTELEEHILAGTLRLGMTKQQVLMTRGYPPRHKTPSIDGDTWIYWSSRFVHRTLLFQDDILVRGRGIN